MKRPTQAAWRKILLALEEGMNVLLRDDLDVEDRIAVYRIHDMLRRRASGGTVMDGLERVRCINAAMGAAREKLWAAGDDCRAKSQKPTRWSRFLLFMNLPGGWDDLDRHEWEERCINRHVAVYENDCRVGQLLCKLEAMRAA